MEILKQGKVDAATMDDEKKRESVENYIAFKNLMFKIDKDEDEYDDDGNLIPNHPQVHQNAVRLLESGKSLVFSLAGLCQGASKPGYAICRVSSQPWRRLQHARQHEWLLSSASTKPSQPRLAPSCHARHEPHPVQPCDQVTIIVLAGV